MIGERLAEVRKDHGDTQEKLAGRLGVTVSAVRSWEQEKSSPSHETLTAVCRLYGVSADYLLGLSDLDPAYLRRGQSRLCAEDAQTLRDLAEFLVWRREKGRRG